MRRKRIISLVLSACLIVGSAVQGGAATTQEKISDAKAQQQANQSSLQQTQEKIQELESKKGESETYLADLNTQLNDLRSSLEKLQNDYDAKQEELTQLQSDLEDAKADEAQQYEAMKLRIRYMYENSASNYMNLLFESGSISDFLNQAENISQMSKYDRDMLDTYRETKEAIQTKEEQVAQEKEEIVALQRESADKQAAVEELVEATYQQIREYQEDIQSQQTAENDLLTKISSQEDAINDLLRQAKEEEAAARLAAQQAAQAAAEKAAQEAAAKEAAEKKAAEDAAAQKAAQQKAAQQAASATQKKSNSSTTTTTTTSNTAANTTTSTTTTDSSDDTIDTSQGKYLGRFKLTAYCSCSICCGKWSGGGTASGTTPTPGRTIAMAGVPFGTKLSINGQIYTVEDRGTAYGHVDIFMGSHSQALSFGMKYADVYQVN